MRSKGKGKSKLIMDVRKREREWNKGKEDQEKHMLVSESENPDLLHENKVGVAAQPPITNLHN